MPRPASLLLALLLSPALLLPADVRAQTPATTVKDSDDNVVLQSNADGGLLAPGTFGSGTIPAEGAGTRLMWYPTKAAFRAGRVDGTQWNASKIGTSSVAFGQDTKAGARAATAMGDGTTAGDIAATAMGDETTARGLAATAMGFGTTASGNAATAMGFGTTAATNNSVTIGTHNDKNRGNDDSDPTTGPLFVIGNGTPGSRSDALVLDQNGNLTTAGNVNGSSDRRLKENITPVGTGTLEKLSRLRPVRYEFKNQETRPSGEQIGLIAQDVQKEFPELVSEGEDGLLSLSYSKFTAVLLKGLQEQQTQIERQRATIDSLETRVQNIEDVQARLDRLETQVQDRSVLAGVLSGRASTFGLGLLLGGLLGAGVLWRRRS